MALNLNVPSKCNISPHNNLGKSFDGLNWIWEHLSKERFNFRGNYFEKFPQNKGWLSEEGDNSRNNCYSKK